MPPVPPPREGRSLLCCCLGPGDAVTDLRHRVALRMRYIPHPCFPPDKRSAALQGEGPQSRCPAKAACSFVAGHAVMDLRHIAALRTRDHPRPLRHAR